MSYQLISITNILHHYFCTAQYAYVLSNIVSVFWFCIHLQHPTCKRNFKLILTSKEYTAPNLCKSVNICFKETANILLSTGVNKFDLVNLYKRLHLLIKYILHVSSVSMVARL